MKFVCILFAITLASLCRVASLVSPKEVVLPVFRNDYQDPNLFQGDMDLTASQYFSIYRGKINPTFRFAVERQITLWPNDIPYEIDATLARHPKAVKAITDGIAEIERTTCIRLKKRTDEKEYLKYLEASSDDKCSASVGYNLNSAGHVNLGKNCWVKGTVIHETMHCLGFMHEQGRPDRDLYVQINWKNINPNIQSQFDRINYDRIDTLNVPYDFKSIMHYTRTSFGNGKNTIDALDPINNVDIIFDKNSLSTLDILKLNLLYNCPGFTSPPVPLPTVPSRPSGERLPTPLVPKGNTLFEIISEGGTQSRATLKIDGVDHSLNRRGHNLVAVSLRSGRLITSKSFDTSRDNAAGNELGKLIFFLPEDSIVMIAIKEDGSNYWDIAKSDLDKLVTGKQFQISSQSSFALIGLKTTDSVLPSWVDVQSKASGLGSSSIRKTIYLS